MSNNVNDSVMCSVLCALTSYRTAVFKGAAGRGGGAITAALFLNEFVSNKVEWAHIDAGGRATVQFLSTAVSP